MSNMRGGREQDTGTCTRRRAMQEVRWWMCLWFGIEAGVNHSKHDNGWSRRRIWEDDTVESMPLASNKAHAHARQARRMDEHNVLQEHKPAAINPRGQQGKPTDDSTQRAHSPPSCKPQQCKDERGCPWVGTFGPNVPTQIQYRGVQSWHQLEPPYSYANEGRGRPPELKFARIEVVRVETAEAETGRDGGRGRRRLHRQSGGASTGSITVGVGVGMGGGGRIRWLERIGVYANNGQLPLPTRRDSVPAASSCAYSRPHHPGKKKKKKKGSGTTAAEYIHHARRARRTALTEIQRREFSCKRAYCQSNARRPVRPDFRWPRLSRKDEIEGVVPPTQAASTSKIILMNRQVHCRIQCQSWVTDYTRQCSKLARPRKLYCGLHDRTPIDPPDPASDLLSDMTAVKWSHATLNGSEPSTTPTARVRTHPMTRTHGTPAQSRAERRGGQHGTTTTRVTSGGPPGHHRQGQPGST
ncbi:hypothetical protein IWX46DRAFT_585663 [Phyllosticta citricarpa]|uniref:Uncharacterized protein n=1 Tax=Phyllosticta citricarpa TaxID=55181 RepID=A0ABR1L3A7_9PEZI